MNLINIFTIELSVIIECLILIYYSNTVMEYRSSKLKSNMFIIIGYLVHGIICALGFTIMNIVSFILITFTAIYFGFSENIGSTLLKTIVLTVLMMFGELSVSLIFRIDLNDSFNKNILVLEDIIFTLASKLIYCIFVIMFKHNSMKKSELYSVRNMLCFLVLPVSTLILLSCVGNLSSELSIKRAVVLLTATLSLIISNFIVYVVYDKMLDSIVKANQRQMVSNKEKLDYVSYQLIKEKYSDLRVMVHDFNKYYNIIEGILSENQEEALSLIHNLKNKNKEFLLVEYTNNKALNILLSQKMKECNDAKIDFQLYVQDVDLSFINEMDIVSIFANLIDNAIESCVQSERKKIFLSIYAVNNAFITIRIDNSSDKEPIINNGILHTRKINKEQHGIGMISIKRALNSYNGRIKWSYNKDTRTFSTTVIINYFALKNKKITNAASF